MDNTITSMELDSFAEDYCKQTIQRIRYVMEKNSISQGMLANRSGLGQSTISKFLAGDTRVSLIHVAKICKALEIDPGEVLALKWDGESETIKEQQDKEEVMQDESVENEMLIRNPSHPAFKGYLRKFKTYFNSTISSENHILEGELEFKKSFDGEKCEVNFILHTGKKRLDGTEITKKYVGTLSISLSLSACYCTLVNKEIGEMCFFVFRHMFLFNQDLVCRLGTAVTVSSGGNKYPTMHRMLISCEELDVANAKSDDFKFVRGQLMLNTSDIVITKDSYNKMKLCEKEFLQSNEMKELLDEFEHQRDAEEVFFIDESKIRNFQSHTKDKVRFISLLREYSINEKYNKISAKADEHMYNYFEN